MKKFLFLASFGLSIIWTASAQTPSPTINGVPGPFIFTGSVTQSGQTFTFSSTGGVTSVSCVTANGVSCSSSGGTTPALTFTLGAITPTSVTASGRSTGQQVGATYQADQYTGADASYKINACIAAVIIAGGGTCDASGLGGVQTISEQINVGSSTQVAANIGVDLVLPNTGVWSVTITNGSCGIMQYSRTALYRGGENGYGGNRLILSTNSTTRVDAIYCTDPSPAGGGSYIRAGGFWANNLYSGTLATALFHVQKLYDQSLFKDMGGDLAYGDVWVVSQVQSGSKFDQIHGEAGDGSGTTGGYPLHVLNGTADVRFTSSSFNNPGTGKSNILVDAGTYDVTFDGVYEEHATADPTDSNIVASGAYDISFTHMGVTASTAANCWQNNTTTGFSVRDSYCYAGINSINDLAYSRTVAKNVNTSVNYDDGPSYQGTINPFGINTAQVNGVPISYIWPNTPFNSGFYYNDITSGTGGPAQFPGNGYMTLVPFYVGTTHTFTAIAIKVTTAGSSGCLLRLGIYNSTASTGLPGTVLLDAGTVACTTSGAVASIAISQTLTPGLYWLADAQQGAPATAAIVDACGICQPMGVVNNTVQIGSRGADYMTGVTGALPTAVIAGQQWNTDEVYLKAQ